MKEFSLDPGVIAFIDSYLEVSGLSNATTVNQQRHQETRQPLASISLKPSVFRAESQGFDAVTGFLFQKRREYIRVGSRATSLLRSVLKKKPGDRTL